MSIHNFIKSILLAVKPPELRRDIAIFCPVRLVKQGKWAKNSITSPEERGTRAQ
jgi:hypothetical protein